MKDPGGKIHGPYVSLDVIATELGKIRALMELQQGVIVTEVSDGYQIAAGRRIKIGHEQFAEQGDFFWHDGQGEMAE